LHAPFRVYADRTSIVLVIIGLLAGGILVGQELIQAAEMRAAVRQLEKYNTAANAFRLKYNCLPGDCMEAEAIGLGTAGGPGHNGDGNGIIGTIDGANGDTDPNAYLSDEGPNFWFHLMRANLINDVVSGSFGNNAFAAATPAPFFKLAASNAVTGKKPRVWIFSGYYLENAQRQGVYEYQGGVMKPHGYYLMSDTNLGGALDISAFTPIKMYLIESKIDDGLPKTGIMQAAGVVVNAPFGVAVAVEEADPVGPNTRTACVDSSVSPNIYNMQRNKDARNCSAIIKPGF
jgi:hypothetical protein